ncbi:MAG: PKD domain-containing protein [Bacteroidia bacterium]
MKKFALLLFALVSFSSLCSGQLVCIYCFNQNDSISLAVTNLITNGSFENNNCTPNTNGCSWCPNSNAYLCNMTGWTSTGGGTGTYSQMFTTLYSAVPQGNVAAYFGNSFCEPCSPTTNDTSCLIKNNCQVTGIPPGYPINSTPGYGGATGLSIEQTVTGLTIGSRYVLEFWTGGEDFGVFTLPGIFGLDIGFGYTILETVPTDFGDIGRRFIVIFDATSTSHTIKFTNWGHICSQCSELTLDHVRLYPVSQLHPSVNPCSAAPFSVTVTGTDPLCFGQCTGTADATPNGGTAPYSYLWSNAATTPNLTNLCAGTYTVTVTDDAGNTASGSITLTAPAAVTVATSSTPTACTPNTGTATATPGGGTPGYTYSWSPSGQTTQTATGLGAGTHTVTVTDDNGCTGTGSVTVSSPAPYSVNMTSTTTTCGNSNGTATATPSGGVLPYTFIWSPSGQITQTATALASGTHTVTVTDGNGCTATGSVNVAPSQQFNLIVTATPPTCNFANGTATATPTGGVLPYTYSWSPSGQTTPTATGLASGLHSVTVTDASGCTSAGSVTVPTNIAPVATTVGTPSFCEGEGGDTLLVVGSGGTSPYYYQWWCHPSVGACGLDSLFDNDPIANPSVSGWYYVQITDANGCLSNIDSVYLTILPKPIVDAGPDIILCGDSAPCQILTPNITGASGPYQYQWSPSLGLNDPFIANPCARPDTTTIYTLVVTAGNGCQSQLTTTDTLSSVIVNVNPVPVADAGPDQHICLLDSATLVGIATNAGPSYTYQWTPFQGVNDPNANVTNASPPLTTTYTLVVWSNGCPSYGDPMTLFVHTLPTIDAGPDREMCLGDSIMLDAMASGDSTALSYSFTWTPALSIVDPSVEDPIVFPVSTTTYHVVAESNYGCGSSSDDVLVTLLPSPIANAGDNATICGGQEFQFQGSYSYTTTNPANPADVFQYWTPGAGMSDPTSLTPTLTPTASGLYTLTVYTGLCSSQDSMLLTVIPEIGLSAVADTGTICSGDSVLLTATTGPINGVTFQWSPITGLADPTSPSTMAWPGSDITYTVVATMGGCNDTTSVDLTVLQSPNAEYINSLPAGCVPHSVSFMQEVEDAIFYTWNFGDGSPVSNQPHPIHVYDRPGSYPVTLTAVSIGGCESVAQSTVVVVSDTLRVDFGSDPTYPIELSFPNTLVKFFHEVPGAVSYDWDFGDGGRSTEANPTHTFLQPGTYQVTLHVTNAEGCISTIVHGPFVVVVPDLFIPNVFSPNDDGVADEFLIQYTGTQPFNLQVHDRWGVKLFETQNKNRGWRGNDLKGQPVTEGVYFYRLRVGDRDFTGPCTLVR